LSKTDISYIDSLDKDELRVLVEELAKEKNEILGNTLVNPIALAEAFHCEYLRQSKKYGWNVQNGTEGKFTDLPEVNRMVMVYTCEALMSKRYLVIPRGRLM